MQRVIIRISHRDGYCYIRARKMVRSRGALFYNIASLSRTCARARRSVFFERKKQPVTSAFLPPLPPLPSNLSTSLVLYLPRILHKNINVAVPDRVRNVAGGQRIDFLVNVSRVAKRSFYIIYYASLFRYRAAIALRICVAICASAVLSLKRTLTRRTTNAYEGH